MNIPGAIGGLFYAYRLQIRNAVRKLQPKSGMKSKQTQMRSQRNGHSRKLTVARQYARHHWHQMTTTTQIPDSNLQS